LLRRLEDEVETQCWDDKRTHLQALRGRNTKLTCPACVSELRVPRTDIAGRVKCSAGFDALPRHKLLHAVCDLQELVRRPPWHLREALAWAAPHHATEFPGRLPGTVNVGGPRSVGAVEPDTHERPTLNGRPDDNRPDPARVNRRRAGGFGRGQRPHDRLQPGKQ